MGQSPILLSTGRLFPEMVRVKADSVTDDVPAPGENEPAGRNGLAKIFQVPLVSSIQVILSRLLPGAPGLPALQA